MSPTQDPATAGLSKILDPVTDCFTPEVAKRVAELKADDEVQARLDVLAEKANEGQLTEEEAAEYHACIQAMDILAIIQARANTILNNGD